MTAERNIKLTIATLTLSIAACIAPANAQEYRICLTDERSDWPTEARTRRSFTKFYVVPDTDDRDSRLTNAIIEGLRREGLVVSSGSADDVPADTEIIISFEAKWVWDLHDKLSESIIYFRDATTWSVLLVSQHYESTGLLGSMPTVEIPRMVNRLNSDDFATPLCWSSQSDK
jgi:hypothetical protein